MDVYRDVTLDVFESFLAPSDLFRVFPVGTRLFKVVGGRRWSSVVVGIVARFLPSRVFLQSDRILVKSYSPYSPYSLYSLGLLLESVRQPVCAQLRHFPYFVDCKDATTVLVADDFVVIFSANHSRSWT